jgi:hypothetical protein
MAYFAELIENLVTQVIAIDDDNCAGGVYPISEPIGQDYIAEIGIEGYWLQTSIEGDYRAVYAGIGYTYDPDLDIFVAPQTEEETV